MARSESTSSGRGHLGLHAVPGLSELGWVMGKVLVAFRWVLETTLLGFTWTGQVARQLPRLRGALDETLRCPRGHLMPAFGVYDCACGAVSEGWVFRPCDVCRESAAYTPCLECGLPVLNPMR